MTSDEMNNAIEFLLRSQANSEVQLEKTNRQIEQTQRQIEQTQRQIEQTEKQLERTDQQLMLTGQRVSLLAETQTEFIQAMTGHVEAQREINADLRRTMRELAQAQKTTQRDISDLTRTVDGIVKTVYKNGNPLQE